MSSAQQKQTIDGHDFLLMVRRGCERLQQHVEMINALNVFPVPDGDTGTNMNMTATSGVKQLEGVNSSSIAVVADALAKGLLLGARGNSGVILSQLFRGFAKAVSGQQSIDAQQFAVALQTGVDAAYRAVAKPVEGTILTVAKDTAKFALDNARWHLRDFAEFMNRIHQASVQSLQHTPNLLPVLKQVGVVDSGGQGLVFMYEGFKQVLNGELPSTYREQSTVVPHAAAEMQQSAQAQLSTDDIEFLYDMEFFIRRSLGSGHVPFDEDTFKKQLERDGDSVLVIVDDEIIKVHVHSKRPGDVLNYALPYGEMTDFHILNMREQHRDLKEQPAHIEGSGHSAPYGIIAVAMGDGIAKLFQGSHVDVVIAGGQTMNPSTEDFVRAIESLNAEHVYILPNNSNIVMAAQQSAQYVSDRYQVTVIPTKTIPQGIAAAAAFSAERSIELNESKMNHAAQAVLSGQVTHAVRDTSIDGIDIREGHYLAMMDKSIVASHSDLVYVCKTLLGSMIEQSEGEVVTILTGEQASERVTKELIQWVQEHYESCEVEVYEGGQPLYPYLIGVE